MRIRSRNGHRHFVYGGHKIREEILNWKKSGNNLLKAGKIPSAPPYFPELATLLLDEGVSEFNIITIPPPSFHDYAHAGGWYPAEVLAENLCRTLKKPLMLLWPERYTEKTKIIMEGNIDKIYTIPEGVKNQFVLILDDIATTGLTLSACCDAVILGGGYPVGVAFV